MLATRSPLHRRGRRRLVLVVALGVAIVVAGVRGAQATHDTVRLQGDSNANRFVVAPLGSDLIFCTDTPSDPDAIPVCFVRGDEEVALVVVDGFDGDDVLILQHGDDVLTNAEGSLPITFVGGTGNDQLVVCDQGACGSDLDSDLAPGAGEELRLTQTRNDRGIVVTIRDASLIRDESTGPLAVTGTSGPDLLTYGPSTDLGRVALNTTTPYLFTDKSDVAIDGAGGVDRVVLDTQPGATEALELADDGPSATTVQGVDGVPDAVVANVEQIEFEQQTAEDDSLTVRGTNHQDRFEIEPAASITAPLIMTAQLARDGDAHTMPTIAVTSDGANLMDLRIDSADADDEILHAGTAQDDEYDLGRAVDESPCGDAGGDRDCLTYTVSGIGRHHLRLRDIESYALRGDDGGDRLSLSDTIDAPIQFDGAAGADAVSLSDTVAAPIQFGGGDGGDRLSVSARVEAAIQFDGGAGADGMSVSDTVAAPIQFDGGGGADDMSVSAAVDAPILYDGGPDRDALSHTATGQPVTIDLAQDTTHVRGSDGELTSRSVEDRRVDASGSSLHVVGTDGPDTLAVRPTDQHSALLSGTAATVPDLTLEGIAGSFTIDPGQGDDHVTITATSGADRVVTRRGVSTPVAINELLPVRTSANVEAISLAGGPGDDEFLVSGTGGPSTFTLGGGDGADNDTLTLVSAPTDTAVTLAGTQGSGRATIGGPAIMFTDLELVDAEGDGTGTLTVSGSDGADVITQRRNRVTAIDGTAVEFSRFPILELVARAGADEIWLAPRSTLGVDGITVDAGGSDQDRLAVTGTAVAESLTYEPTGRTTGTVRVATAPRVDFTAAEAVSIDGANSPSTGDTLNIDSSRLDGELAIAPGTANDAGSIGFHDVSGTATSAAPVSYSGLGAGAVTLVGERTDRLVIEGRDDADAFMIEDDGTVRVDERIPIVTPGIHTVVLEGREGDDTFQVPAVHPFPDTGAAAIRLRGGTGSDSLTVRGAGTPLTADLTNATVTANERPHISHHDVETLRVDAASAQLTVTGTADPDAFDYTPAGPDRGTVTAGASTTPLQFEQVGDLILDPASGNDTVTVHGSTDGESIAITRGEPTTVRVGSSQAATIPTTAEAITVDAAAGSDTISVRATGGPGTLTVSGGGGGADLLELHAPTITISSAMSPQAGTLDSPGGPVHYASMSSVGLVGDGSGTLTVAGSDTSDTIATGTGERAEVRVDDATIAGYTGYRSVILDGRGGDDTLTVGYRHLDGAVDLVRAVGGDGHDVVTAVDSAGTTRAFTIAPASASSATMTAEDHAATLAATTVEALSVVGQGGNDHLTVMTPAKRQDIIVMPTGAQAGNVQVAALLPVSFRDVGSLGQVTLADAAGTRGDALAMTTTDAAEQIAVVGPADQVRLAGWLRLTTASVRDLTIDGQDGHDTFTAQGPLPFATTTLDGGGPDDGDHLDLEGPTGDVTVDLSTTTVSGYGGSVRFPGIHTLHTDIGGGRLTDVGTIRDDAVCVDTQAPRDGRIAIVGAPGSGLIEGVCAPEQRGGNVLHTFVDAQGVLLDPADGTDEVIVNGTTEDDYITLAAREDATLVTVHPEPSDPDKFRVPIELDSRSTESVVIAADRGADDIDLTIYNNAAPVFAMHGGSPATAVNADHLLIRDGAGGATFTRDVSLTDPSDGTVIVTYRPWDPVDLRIDHHDIEDVRLAPRVRS